MPEMDLSSLKVNLRTSINTDTIAEDFKNFGDDSAPLLVNTGIERDGGVTNIYENETTYSEAGEYIITEDGRTISIVDSSVPNNKVIKVDGKAIGQASSFGVEKRISVEAADDVFLTTNGYVTCSLIDSTITVTEYNLDQVQLNTRNITFTNLGTILSFFTSLSFVRYNGMQYSDSLEFALRLGDQVVILQESDTGITITKALQSSSALGTNTINASVVYNGTLVVAGNGGRVASFDGTAWRNYDGSGTGVGVYNSGDATLGVVGSNNILSLCVYTYLSNTYLVVGGASGRVGSWNGTSWIIWSSGGTIANNATAISTDNVNAMVQAGNYLIIAGSVGKIGSWSGTAWTNYNVAGVSDNATLIGAVSINALCAYTDFEGGTTLIVAGASGRIGSMKIQAGTNWVASTIPANTGGFGYQCLKFVGGIYFAGFSWNNTRGITYSYDGTNWNYANTPPPSSGSITDIAYGNGLFVAVANSSGINRMFYSYDGINWIRGTLPSTNGTISVTYGNGVFVAVANTTSTTAGIITSPDGITWTFQTTSAPGGNWRSVTYGNGLFVALANTTSTTAGIITSPDGITWTFQTTSAPGGNWRSVTYGNGLFVAIAATTSTTAGIATSPDGITWTFRTTTAPGGVGWQSVAYGNGLWVAVAGTTSTTAGVATSPDGITWTFRTTTVPGGSWQYVTYGNNIFLSINTTATELFISQSNSSQKLIYTSTSTPLYPTNNGTVIGANAINAMAQYNDQLVVAGNGGLVGSFGGVSWVNYNQTGLALRNSSGTIIPNSYSAAFTSLTYGNGIYVAVCNTTSTTTGIATSQDGVNWTFRTLPSAPGGKWKSVAYGNGVFVAVANTTSTTAGIATSPDGITWTFTTTTAPGAGWERIAYGNNLFVAVALTTSTTTGIATSPDGITWTFRTTTAPGGSIGWSAITYGNGLFVATAATTSTTAGIATSPDGTTWTFRTTTAPGGSTGWVSVTYGNGLFVAVATTTSTTAGIATSVDGVTWIFRTTSALIAAGWTSVTYGNGLFMASELTFSTTAGIATSADGITWTSQTYIVNSGWYNVFYFNELFFAMTSSNISAKSIFILKKAYYDNATIIGSNNILSLAEVDGDLAVGGVGGRLGSFNTDASKNIYTSGTGISNNASIIGANDIKSMVDYDDQLIISGASSTVNSMSSTGAFTPFYNDGGSVVANLLTGFNSLGYLYTYRYENGQYLVLLTGNSLNKAYTLDNSTKAIATITAKFAVPQVSNNLTRHIISASNTNTRPIYDGSNIKAAGLVGYTDFSTYSGTVVYPPAAYTLGNGNVLQSQAGFGYTDFTFKLSSSATNVYNYIPQFQANTSGLYQVIQSNSNTLINAYGKLTNNLGLTPTKPFEFRVGWTNGVQSYLSTALLDGIASDTLGTIVTNVGEFDDTYTPHIVGDDKLLYFYENKHIVIKIGTNITQRVQKVDNNIYKLNSISPLNIVDPSDNTLRLGSIDFNNRMLFSSSVSPTTSTKIASYIQGRYSNSIDTGDKLVTILNPDSNSVEVIGYRIPVVSTSVGDYSVDTYYNDIYSFSTLNDGSELVVSSRVNTIYVSTTILPISLAVEYALGTATVGGNTIFLKPSYDGYSIGNDIVGEFTSFLLFGQTYLFDGNNIYAASIDEVNGIFNSKTLIAPASGLQYIASSPTEVYFLSGFDNSLYTFSGGRNLNKFKRLNRLPKVNSGVFNVVDNTLLFDTDTSFIWVRDSVITENYKAVDQTDLKYYSTKNGIVISNNAKNWTYTYESTGNSAIVPLSIQTPYFGFNVNEKSILTGWVVTIYNEDKGTVALKGTSSTIDEDASHTQVVNWNINPIDYNDGGYVRLRLQPQYQRTLGTSLKLDTDSKVIVVSIVPEFKKGESGVVAKARSR